MSQIYEVQNIQEAVTLASKFKNEGKYNWFRGQTVDWPPYSSYLRRAMNKTTEDALLRYNLFLSWLQETYELKYLLEPENLHQLEAIMQHYGIPTYYIDFTTEPSVAGYFAADTNTPPASNKKSCIYCLDIDNLLSVWEHCKNIRKGAMIEKVVIDVKNLWRLQSQHGVFLFCNYNWEVDYAMDRILFPYSGYPSYPTKDIIYPEHKSQLEILMDQYFDREKTTLFHFQIEKLYGQSILSTQLEPFPNGIYAEAFKNPSDLRPLPSWSEHEISSWENYTTESFNETVGLSKKLILNPAFSVTEIKNAVSFGVLQILQSVTNVRTKTIDWNLVGLPQEFDIEKTRLLLTKVWNGMRFLPYSNDDISQACGITLYLNFKGKNQIPDQADQLNIFTELFGKSMRVGFAHEDKSGSYGYAAYQSIINSTRSDISMLLNGELVKNHEDPFDLFRVVYNPRLLFDFNKFKKFFAEQVIPSQVAWQQSLVLYNPARLLTFGIP